MLKSILRRKQQNITTWQHIAPPHPTCESPLLPIASRTATGRIAQAVLFIDFWVYVQNTCGKNREKYRAIRPVVPNAWDIAA
jgi:hypothetical protein